MNTARIIISAFLLTMVIALSCDAVPDDGAAAVESTVLGLGAEETPDSDGKGAPGGNTLNVPADYPTIQSAIEAAADGDTVAVAPGLYPEDLTMKWGVWVVGDLADPPVIFGSVTFTNLEGATLAAVVVDGILSSGSVGVVLKNSEAVLDSVHVTNFTTCVGIAGPLGLSVVSGSELTGCDTGLSIDGTMSKVDIVNNIVTGNAGNGISLSDVDGVVDEINIVNNTVAANGFGLNGAGLYLDALGGYVAANNILVGNAIGVYSTLPETGDYNIVWGNSVNYGGASLAGLHDITKDPRFANWAEGDFHLLFDSPAIDAGTTASCASTDKDGYDRPQGDGPDVGAYEYVVANNAITLAINEIMANPVDESTGEFVELYNYGGSPMDAAGLVIDDGDSTDVLAGWQDGPTAVPAGGYAVILDPGYDGEYDIPAGAILLTVASSKTIGSGLANSDPVFLRDPATNLPIDSYSFPFNAGNGVSVEKDSVEEGDVTGNWRSSPCGNTPGKENCASLPPNESTVVYIAINEVMANPLNEGTGEYVELYNFADEAIDVGGFFLSDGDATSQIAGWEGGSTLLLPGEFALVLDPDYAGQYDIPGDTVLLVPAVGAKIGSGLAVNDPITLFDLSGLTVVDTYTHTSNPGNGTSMEKVDFIIGDVGGNWTASPCGLSPGSVNCAYEQGVDPASGATLVITEVMANPLDEDTGEFVELFNYGDVAVDVTGFKLDDGDAVDTIWGFNGGPAIVAPNTYAVILDAEYADQYDIPGGVALLTTDDTTLGNGLSNNDPVTLKADSGTDVIDSFMFPFNPGNGLSAEKIAIVVGDVPQNWTASPCMSSPGETNCAAGGEDSSVSTVQLVISEVMSNPLNEGTGEFVELFNAGNSPVDAAGMWLADSATMEMLQAFGGGASLIEPGEFAVILDSGYAGEYQIPQGTVLLTTDNANLGNGLSTSDSVTLYENDGVSVVSTFSFPYNPGNGKSVEKVTLTSADVQPNWATSTCSIADGALNDGSSPGSVNCVDPYGGFSGTNSLGQPCPMGGGDCLSGLCAIDSLNGLTWCTSDCSVDACPAQFECTLTGDVNYPWICVPTVSMCEDECVSGERTCLDDSSHVFCADYNGDGCVEWGGQSSCPAWAECSGGECVLGAVPDVVINELLYDAVGGDTDVFVELSGPAGFILDGLSLVGINGSNGSVYNAIGLTGVFPPDGFFVIAHPSAGGAIAANADLLDSDVDYQNGPDSVELRWGTGVVDAVAYGSFAPDEFFAGEGTPAPDVDPGSSLTRDALSTDTDNNADDFQETAVPTPGS